MSILNVVVRSDQVSVAVDTRMLGLDGGRFDASKLLVLPHLNLVFAARGTIDCLMLFFAECLGSSRLTFDLCREGGPPLLARLTAANPAPRCQVEEILIAGWSDAEQRLCAFIAATDVAADHPTRRDLTSGLYLSPGACFTPVVPEPPRTDAEMMALARLQLRWMLTETPTMATGGDLVVAELTRGQIVVRNLGAITSASPALVTGGGRVKSPQGGGGEGGRVEVGVRSGAENCG